jgi:enoyl-CoA hydratase
VIVELRIDRPERRNALDTETVERFRHHLRLAAASNETRAVVIHGGGSEAFCAGQDVKELATMDAAAKLAAHAAGQALMMELADHPCLTLAAIEGHCLGGGLELALACDVRIAGDSSSFGLPEVARDMLPTWGAHQRLAQMIGLSRAKEVLLLDRRLTAAEARAWGLLAEITPSGQALQRCQELAATAVAGPKRTTLAKAKWLMAAGVAVSPEHAAFLDALAEASQP